MCNNIHLLIYKKIYRHGTINHTLIKERIFISRVAFKTHIKLNVY